MQSQDSISPDPGFVFALRQYQTHWQQMNVSLRSGTCVSTAHNSRGVVIWDDAVDYHCASHTSRRIKDTIRFSCTTRTSLEAASEPEGQV